MAERIFGSGVKTSSAIGKNNAPYIGTFHSLGAKILRKECRSLGREPNFAIFLPSQQSLIIALVMVMPAPPPIP